MKGFDYPSVGAYFVTVCTRGKICLLGEVVDGEMVLNEAGHMVYSTLMVLPQRFAALDVDCHVIMPNHLHAVLVIGSIESEKSVAGLQLGTIVGAFKSITTREYAMGVGLH